MPPRAAFVSRGFDVWRGRAQGDAAAWYGAPPHPRLKSLSGQRLSYLQKREENSRDGRDWHAVLLAQKMA